MLGYQLAQASIVTLQVYDAEVGSRFELRPVGGSWPARARVVADAVAPWAGEAGSC